MDFQSWSITTQEVSGVLKGSLKVKPSALFLVRLPQSLGKVSWFISPSISHIHLVLQGQQSF